MAERYCIRCEGRLTADEIALFRKLICREAEEYLCMDCLSRDLDTPRKRLEELVDYYHRTGVCCLFPKYEEANRRDLS